MSDDKKAMLRVTVEDLETGEKATRDVPSGDYMLLVTAPAYVAHTNVFANGTHVVTIKGRTR
jgi:hypothetical protein